MVLWGGRSRFSGGLSLRGFDSQLHVRSSHWGVKGGDKIWRENILIF